MKRILSYTENITFVLAILIASYVLINIINDRRNLPPGACPVETYNGWIYLAVMLGVVSIVIMFIKDRVKSK